MTTPGDILDQAIAVYNTQEITNEQLADIIGFDDDEREMMRMFWDKCFNGSWMLLTKEIVSKYLSDETGHNMMCNFVNRVMIKFGRRDIDYMEVDKTHELVQEYFDSSILRNRKDVSKMNRNNWFIITGHYFKSLLMMATSTNGLKARSYYMKIEMLVVVMRDYMANKLRHDLMAKDIQIEDRNAQINAKDTQIHDLSKKFRRLDISHKQLLHRRSYPMFNRDGRCMGRCLYVIRNTKECGGQFKFGIAKNIDTRLKQHRTDMSLSIVITIIYTIEASLLENALKVKLKKAEKLNPVNHEFTQNTTSDEILAMLDALITAMDMDVTYEDDDTIEEYNDDVLLDEAEATDDEES